MCYKEIYLHKSYISEMSNLHVKINAKYKTICLNEYVYNNVLDSIKLSDDLSNIKQSNLH